MSKSYERNFVYGFKGYHVTVEEFQCSQDEVDWMCSVKDSGGPVDSLTIKTDLLTRWLYWTLAEMQALKTENAQLKLEAHEDKRYQCQLKLRIENLKLTLAKQQGEV